MHEPSVEFDLSEVEALRGPLHYDRRIAGLSPAARRAVVEYFHGSVDAALVCAERAYQNFSRPAEWVCEIRALARRG
jgi:hypothetical protein